MSDQPIERVIQEYVPGKQVTLAHLIPNPNKEIYAKLGLPEDSNAIGILTITPSEAAIIAGDVAKKSGNVSIGFIDRLPHNLVASFKSTLAEALQADLIIHVVDYSNPNYLKHINQQILA